MIPWNYVNEMREQFEMADFYFDHDRDVLLKGLAKSANGAFIVVQSTLPFPIKYELLVRTVQTVLYVPISIIGNSYQAENERFSSLKLLIDFYVRSGVLITDDGELSTSMTPCQSLQLIQLTAPMARSAMNMPSNESARKNIATLHEPNWPASPKLASATVHMSTCIYKVVSEQERPNTINNMFNIASMVLLLVSTSSCYLMRRDGAGHFNNAMSEWK